MSAIGIDFGTTNSVMSVAFEDGNELNTQPFLDKETKLPHPSVVWFKGNDIIVGSEAKAHLNTFVDVPGNRFISSIKTNLGDHLRYDILGLEYQPYQIAGEIFKYLKNYALKEYKTFITKEISDCVVTVPISFTGNERNTLRKAANESGLHIKTFIHEPFAAIVWYMFMNDLLKSEKTRNYLVFDWGGGTLDITLARYENGKLYEINNSGIKNRSGDYFDAKIESYSISEFARNHNLSLSNIHLSKSLRDRLKYVSEKEKIQLSKIDSTNISLASFYNDKDLDIGITRKIFEELILKDIEEAYSTLIGTVSNSNYSDAEIESVLLIGGSSLIPAIYKKVLKKYGTKLIHVENASSIISEGASIISYYDYKPFLVNPIKIKLYDNSDYTIFEKDTILNNNYRSLKFFCTDNRDGEARLIIVEGNQTKTILNVPVSPDLPKPYNHERINAEFRIDENLILHISARGATKEIASRDSVHDLRYGLMIKEHANEKF